MMTELRSTGIDVVGDMPWGTHFCHFYETEEDLLDILIPYFKAGLESNEFCMWIVFDPLDKEGATDALRRAIPGMDRRLAAGDIEIMPHTQWYLNDGAFDLRRVINGWKEKLAGALARGYAGMRVNGNEAWLTEQDWNDFLEYEKKLNEVIADRRMIVLCTYPLALSRASEIFDVARTHEFAIARRHGNWEVLETPELKQAKSEVKRLNEELEQRIDKRTMELVATTEELRREIISCERAEEALKRSEGELRTLFAAMTDVVLVLDAEGRYVKIAPTNPLNLYRPSEELLGRTLHQILPKEEADRFFHQIGRVLESRQKITFEYKLNIGSREVWFESNVSPLTENTVFWIARDITEQKTLEEIVRRTQKMEAIGTLAGGIAHDFNNILGIISGYAEMAQMDAGEASPAGENLREALKAVRRAKELVQQILAFSRQGEHEKKSVQVGLIVKEAMNMLRASLPSSIEIKVDVASTAFVFADPTQIHQVLMNLCTNGAHAMREHGGVLEASLTDVRLGAEAVRSHSGLQAGLHVRLTVKDTGHGIDPSILDRIFDPFFTTKEPGVGTGLGLSVVHGIVKSLGGTIEAESHPGRGTAFQLLLPAMESAPRPETVETASLPRGRERVLVVDDEPPLAKAIKQMLERLGYEVEYRTNGIEAFEAFRHHPADKPFDLVITDMTMPHLTGVELARKLRRLQPGLGVILCTGFSEKIDAEKAKILGIQGFLMKPVVLGDLAELVRRVLDDRKKSPF